MAKNHQVTKRTKKQIGHNFGQLILDRITEIANGARDVVQKGRALHAQTGQPIEIGCSPADVLNSLSPDQKTAVLEFIDTWATEPPPQPKPSRKPKTDKVPRQ